MDVRLASSLNEADGADYDRFVDEAAGGHYSQSRAWATVATAAGRRKATFFLARRRGRVFTAGVVLRPIAFGPIATPIAIMERGPVVADVADLEDALATLVHAAHRAAAARVTAMPYFAGADAERAERALRIAGFRDVQATDGAHVATLRMDIAGKSDDAIMDGPERSKLRRELRRAERLGVTVRAGSGADFAILERLNGALMESQGKTNKPRAWFDAVKTLVADDPTRGALFVCEHEGAAIASLLVIRHAKIAVFVTGASIPEPRQFSKMALPMMAGVRWARDQGCAIFDLGGVPMEDDHDEKRAQIAQFKHDFEKTRVRLVHEHARWF